MSPCPPCDRRPWPSPSMYQTHGLHVPNIENAHQLCHTSDTKKLWKNSNLQKTVGKMKRRQESWDGDDGSGKRCGAENGHYTVPKPRQVAKKYGEAQHQTTMINPLRIFIVERRDKLHSASWQRSATCRAHVSTPAERHRARPVGTFLHQWLVELATWRRVDTRPARLAVVLQTGHVGTEERSELSTAVNAGTLVTDLVVENVWFHLNLPTQTIITPSTLTRLSPAHINLNTLHTTICSQVLKNSVPLYWLLVNIISTIKIFFTLHYITSLYQSEFSLTL